MSNIFDNNNNNGNNANNDNDNINNNTNDNTDINNNNNNIQMFLIKKLLKLDKSIQPMDININNDIKKLLKLDKSIQPLDININNNNNNTDNTDNTENTDNNENTENNDNTDNNNNNVQMSLINKLLKLNKSVQLLDININNDINKLLKLDKSIQSLDININNNINNNINKDNINEDNIKLNQDSDQNFNSNLKMKLNIDYNNDYNIDYASSIGDDKILTRWVNDNLDNNNKFIGSISDYSSDAIDNASSNCKINILDLWLKFNKENGIILKYTEKAINLACKFNNVKVLDWWIKSKLELKYNHNAIDYASAECNIEVLEWLYDAKKKYNWNFDYTSNSIDNAIFEENKLLKLVKWWKVKMNEDPTIKFKYTINFINYLERWKYDNVYNYLKENKMINHNKLNPNSVQDSEPNLINIIKMFGIPTSIPLNISEKKNSNLSSKYNLDLIPEDIKNHIKEKEEELNNYMPINGKTKEYLDNLIKIPFGKYKIEKIFSFIGDLIKKLNCINSQSENNFIKSFKILNESDIINFFDKVKIYFNDNYIKYSNLFDKFIIIRKKYMNYVSNILNNTVYGHNATKKHIKCIISQWLTGGFKTGVVIGIQGPPGVGKTTIIKGALSKCLVDFIDYNFEINEPYINEINYDNNNDTHIFRPFCFMSLGGTTDSSTLLGHNITYHGATYGNIVKNLKQSKIMNPILYFDELDKISNTKHGHDISSVLTHITDPVQNSHFTDRYFAEIEIDLSKCIIVFSYNDTNKINKILLDRIQEIRLEPIKLKEKLIISKKFIIPEICEQLGLNINFIKINDKTLELIINEYTLEAGVRKLKEKLYEIFRMNHLELIENDNNLKITDIKNISFKLVNDIFSEYPKINHKKIKSHNMIGCINGLYASISGIGGIVPIQAKQIFVKENLAISITGSVEKVMEESIKVARTVAWNLLTRDEQNNVIQLWDSRGIHVHFPDGATPKDGPSAGTAITCAIYSLLTSKIIKNNIAITGEIDLDGNVTEIGGLDAKLNGAKNAGINIVLIPEQNHRELETVKKNNPFLIDNKFKVYKINHVLQALTYIF